MAKRIIPNQFKTQLVNSFIDSTNTNVYYAFVGDHITTGSTDEDVSQPLQGGRRPLSVDSDGRLADPFKNMIFGKQLQQADLKLMARRYDWQQDVIYTQYDDANANLFNESFYVSVDEEEDVHVYKCLNNNNSSPSTVRPTIDGVINNEDYYETDDGYVWKYMYSIYNTVFRRFATEKYIPIINSVDERIDKDVLIRNGAIDVIAVDFAGQFYNNYIEDTLQPDDLVGDNPLEYRLPSRAAIAEGFYKNTWMYLDDNNSPAGGQFRRVVNSKVRQGRVFVELEDGFSIPPIAGTSYKISPIVDIFGNGTETVAAAARAVINSTASNSVHRVEIMERGLEYSFAIASVRKGVSANSIGGSAGVLIDPIDAVVRPILPPPGGHASNPGEELGARALMIQMKFANTENGTIPAENTFAQFGVIKNPQFSNVEINFVKKSDSDLEGSDGDFTLNEKFIQFKKIRLCGNTELTVSPPNNFTVRAAGTDPEDSPGYNRFLNVGDLIYLNNDDNENDNFIGKITSLSTDGFQIDLESISDSAGVPTWGVDEQFNTRIHIALKISEGIIRDIPFTGTFFAENVTNKLIRNELIIGLNSLAIARINSVNISNRPGANGMYDFFTFIQAVRCEGTVPSDDFFNDQRVYQGNTFEQATMRARVHSFKRPESGAPTLLLTNVEGTIDTSRAIEGLENSATMSPGFDKYEGDLDPTTGSIIYLQNDVPIERDETSTEQVRVILEF